MTIVAYLVTSHRLPHQVLRLLATLRALSPDAPVLVHHDDRSSALDRDAVAALGGVQLIPPEPRIEWGRGSQLAMYLRALRFAVEHARFDWLVLLSGQDYPVRPLAVVEAELGASEVDGFVEGHPVTPPPWRRDCGDEFARRYFHHWRRIPEPGRLGRRAIAAARPLLALRDVPSGVLLGHRARTPFTTATPCRRGSDWLTLNRRCAELVDCAGRDQAELLAHFRRTVLPTEAFAHTVLHAEPGLRLSGDVRRFTRWAPGSPHPQLLRLADLDAILASGTDFARKFDVTVDAEVLDALDARIGR